MNNANGNKTGMLTETENDMALDGVTDEKARKSKNENKP